VLADALAAQGYVVLTYDKRGVGTSEGDWSRANFSVLGADAAAGMEHLRARPDVAPERVALIGSSQAGWVVAKAIQDGAEPAGVFLLGAAGSALTVEEQNLYNTRVLMRCERFGDDEIERALAQQQAFFAFLHDPLRSEELDRLTEEGRRSPRLADWLFPSSSEVDLTAGDWFTTLELDFDPLPVWQAYEGLAAFVFAEHDDSTPTALALERLRPLSETAPDRFMLTRLDDAQHLGLVAPEVCSAGLGERDRFNPALFEALAAFGSRVGAMR
jgi:hypothetical protein